jgi:protein SCO1/2
VQLARLPVLVLLLVLAGCGRSTQTGQTKEKLYDLKGKVVEVDAGKKTVVLDHEDIPGYMKAMRATFPVADSQLLQGLNPGDEVEGKLQVGFTINTITELRKR